MADEEGKGLPEKNIEFQTTDWTDAHTRKHRRATDEETRTFCLWFSTTFRPQKKRADANVMCIYA